MIMNGTKAQTSPAAETRRLSGGTQSDMLRYVVHGWGKGSLLRWGRISLKTVGTSRWESQGLSLRLQGV